MDNSEWFYILAIVLKNPFSLAITPFWFKKARSQIIESIRKNNFIVMNVIFLPVQIHSPQKAKLCFKAQVASRIFSLVYNSMPNIP